MSGQCAAQVALEPLLWEPPSFQAPLLKDNCMAKWYLLWEFISTANAWGLVPRWWMCHDCFKEINCFRLLYPILIKKKFCFHRCAFTNPGEEIMIHLPLSTMYLISLIHIIWQKNQPHHSQNNGAFGITVYGYASFRAECEAGESLGKGRKGYSRFSGRQSSSGHPFCLILCRVGKRRQCLQRIPQYIMEGWIRSTLPAQGDFYQRGEGKLYSAPNGGLIPGKKIKIITSTCISFAMAFPGISVDISANHCLI